jgi:plastocyanin
MHKNLFLALSILLTAGIATSPASAATLTIKTPFEGAAPVAEKIKTDADPKCKLMHADGLASDQVIVNSNNTLKNVLVYAKEGVTGKFETPKEAKKLDQVGCAYTPKIFGIQVGQPLEIVNSDDTLHNVHALPTQSKEFNLGMPIKGMKLKKSFDKPEVPVKIKCEVHPWMSAHVGVFEHPFYGVTGEDGSTVIKDIPAGEYTIEAWHEKYGAQTQKVTVADQDQELTFQFKA